MAITTWTEYKDSIMDFNDDGEALAEAKALLRYLMIERGAITQSGGDGVNITRDINALREYIKFLQEEISTNSCSEWIWQMRIDR